jgi:glycosyl transferase family 25
MITIKLGGGLGNQLYQLAFMEYIHKYTGKKFFIKSLKSPDSDHSEIQYFESIFKKWANNYSPNITTIDLYEGDPPTPNDWISIVKDYSQPIEFHGYFQRYEYTDHVRNIMKEKLSFDNSILNKYPDIKNTIFLHIRGGDYTQNDHYNIDLVNYYLCTIQKCKDYKFSVFTNDLPYASKILSQLNILNYEIIEENEIDSLFLMINCRGGICANSTFSWWGAYLNDNRDMIFLPSKWGNSYSLDLTTRYFFKDAKIVSLAPYLDFIEKVVYINLKSRTDRRARIEKELLIFPYNKIIRFDGRKHMVKYAGCTLSHIGVLEMAIKNNWSNVLIVEDDMKFISNDFSLVKKLSSNAYDVISFGGANIDYDPDTYKLNRATLAHCYLVSRSYYHTLLQNLKEGLEKLIATEDSTLYANDQYWSKIQATGKWFVIYPAIATQVPGYSDNEKRDFDVDPYLNIIRKKTIPKFSLNRLLGK